MKMLDRDRTLGPRLVAEIYAQFAVYVDGTNAISKASVAANRSVRICSSVNRFRFMASLYGWVQNAKKCSCGWVGYKELNRN